MAENELYHYGIKGMKWGVRRTPAQLARARGETPSSKIKNTVSKITSKKNNKSSSKKSDDKKVTKESSDQKKKLSDMTDEELKKAVTRLQLESTYKKLNPEKVSAGKKFFDTVTKQVVGPVLLEASKNAIRPYVEDAMKSALNKALKKKK